MCEKVAHFEDRVLNVHVPAQMYEIFKVDTNH